MSTNNTSQASGGIGFFGLLTIVFIVLKLTHFIDWSWWWVTAALWLPAAVVIAGLVIWFVVSMAVAIIKDRRYKKQRKQGRIR